MPKQFHFTAMNTLLKNRLPLVLLTFGIFSGLHCLQAQETEVPGKEILKSAPRPKRPELKAAALPLSFFEGERIALVGNSTAEKMNLYGNFETRLHLRFPEKKLVVRNFARPADEVGNRQKPGNYDLLDDPLYSFSPDTVLCFFGSNESYSGPEGVDGFKRGYLSFLQQFSERYTRDDSGSKVRFILVTPAAFENTNDPLLPDAAAINKNLSLYADAVTQIGKETKWPVVDIFIGTKQQYDAEPECQFTLAGFAMNEQGDAVIGKLLDEGLFGKVTVAPSKELYAKVKVAVVDKSWVHLQDYRMLNGWYVYGGRRTWDHETFPNEYLKIRQMAALRDAFIWDLASGKTPAPIDDDKTNSLTVPATRFGDPRQKYSEPPELKYLSPSEFIASTEVAKDLEIKLFADETKFPELAKPVQLNFDSKGRLWVACMPTYPQWRPGDKHPNDRLLIFEDTDGDGTADKCKTFYDKLHCPTGFEFYNGGVLVVDQPRMIWLKDTDGDDKADQIVEIMDGWGTDDTHHTIGAFEFSHGGLLHMLEGVAMSTTLETPWGPKRWSGAAGSFVFDPKTFEIKRFTTPGYGNPWCMTFDPWGQGVVGDGTNAQQHWATALSGNQIGPRRGLDAIFDNQGMRPALGNEFIFSKHLPDSLQGQFTYACVINMNGMPRFRVRDDGAGFAGERIMNDDGTPNDLIRSKDKNFRPADPQVGPDGALWFGDWCNALIGHMQYSQRDPNRDHVRGRVYRLVAKDRALVKPVIQFGKSESELLEQLRAYEPRTRYRVRRELEGRPKDKVIAAVAAWVAKLPADDPERDRLLTEALWICQTHHAVDNSLIASVLASSDPRARAAAVHAVSDLMRLIPNASDIFVKASTDAHPRVRAEAARALSFVPTEASVDALLNIASTEQDKWLRYIEEHSIGALQQTWEPLYKSGALAGKNPAGLEAIEKYLSTSGPGIAAERQLKVLLAAPEVRQQVARNNAYAALENLRGKPENGKAVFARVCANCHQIDGKGYTFGPELTKVATRLNRHDLIESIVEPSAKMDPKFLTEIIRTTDEEIITGFIMSETKTEITLALPEGKKRTVKIEDIEERKVAKQSSMPENLGGTIAPAEFLDLIEYMTSLK
ncbi:MAG: HEAT repeat domain-containing protein [Planctomycetota bacterium]|nr:HEAT repeat domain-containing protein [Planctomycetota bacterium]